MKRVSARLSTANSRYRSQGLVFFPYRCIAITGLRRRLELGGYPKRRHLRRRFGRAFGLWFGLLVLFLRHCDLRCYCRMSRTPMATAMIRRIMRIHSRIMLPKWYSSLK